VRFDPVSDYFQHRHVWVLLSGLPLHLWNTKSLTTIGNELGHFLVVHEEALNGNDRQMGRVQVELDIHKGLLETLDIEWRRRVIGQKLDYLGVPFRCSFCRRMGHLRKNYPGYVYEEESESSMLRKTTYYDSPGITSPWCGEVNTTTEDSDLSQHMELS